MKLAPSLLLLSALAAPTLPRAFGQTTAATTPKPAATHKASAAKPGAKTSAIPHVAGLPKTLFALRYIDITVGTGPLAIPRKWYTVNYTGWMPDGTKFDSSYDRKEPIVFPYGAHQVIIGWDTGFEGMHVGGKRRLFIPYQLAYGDLGKPPIPPKSPLIFDIELLGFSDNAPPRPAAAAPPTKPADPSAKPTEPAKPADPAAKTADPASSPTTTPATPPNPGTQPITDPTKPTVDPKSAPPPPTSNR